MCAVKRAFVTGAPSQSLIFSSKSFQFSSTDGDGGVGDIQLQQTNKDGYFTEGHTGTLRA